MTQPRGARGQEAARTGRGESRARSRGSGASEPRGEERRGWGAGPGPQGPRPAERHPPPAAAGHSVSSKAPGLRLVTGPYGDSDLGHVPAQDPFMGRQPLSVTPLCT